MDTIITTILSGALGGIAGAIISIFYQNKHYRGNLVEKWISTLRDEISIFLGLTEKLRLLKKEIGEKDDELLHQIQSKKQKIHMLLNDETEQVELFKLAESVIQIADNKDSNFSAYNVKEKNLIEATRKLLRKEWHKIYKISWLPLAVLIFIFVAISFLVFYYKEQISALLKSHVG